MNGSLIRVFMTKETFGMDSSLTTGEWCLAKALELVGCPAFADRHVEKGYPTFISWSKCIVSDGRWSSPSNGGWSLICYGCLLSPFPTNPKTLNNKYDMGFAESVVHPWQWLEFNIIQIVKLPTSTVFSIFPFGVFSSSYCLRSLTHNK